MLFDHLNKALINMSDEIQTSLNRNINLATSSI